MNDETKDELMKRTREWLQSCVNAATRSGVPEEADLEAFLLAHIDGEPARLAAALENLREACAWAVRVEELSVLHSVNPQSDDFDKVEHGLSMAAGLSAAAKAVRATPLDATPLADELRTLRARVAELEAQVANLLEVNAVVGQDCNLRADKAEARAEKAEAQVAAARAACEEILKHTSDGGKNPVADDVLRAMDEAAKK